jgi:DegV family protein with EDD domain
VPDGDTGTNLALTFNSIAHRLSRLETPHAGNLLTEVADAALDGARGNSGAILAQFLQGLADALGEVRTIAPAAFANAMHTGNEYARTALGEPKEGTILSVIRDVANEIISQQTIHAHDFVPILEAGLATGQRSLEATRQGLEQMRKANVVDAGAKGFILMLEGIVRFLHSGSLSAVPDPFAHAEAELEGMGDVYDAGDVEHRYCTECMLTGENINRRKLREALSALGSSLVLAGTQRKTKIHIHVDEPDQVFATAGRFGTVSNQKADDMLQQSHAVREGTPRVAVVTDSGADLPDHAYEDLGIHLVPLRVHFGDRGYLDKIGMSADQFFDTLAKSEHHPKTSQPAPGDFRRTYEYLASHFDDVVSVSLSSGVSGTFQAAQSAAERVAGPGRVTVVDSGTATVGQGLVAMYAAECAAAGHQGPEVAESARAAMDRTLTFGLLTDLTYAVRGGRVKPLHKRIADLLRVAVVLKVGKNARVVPGGVIPRSANPVPAFAGYLRRRIDRDKTYRIAIGYAQDRDLAEQLERQLRLDIPSVESVHIVELGAAIGAHCGAGTLVVAAQEYIAPRQH